MQGVKRMKKLIKASTAAAMVSLLFAGCTSTPAPVAVTEENAPSDLLKSASKITNESTADEMIQVFQGIVDQTYESYGGSIVISEDAKGKGLDANADTIKAIEDAFKSYDVRIGAEDRFYQLYEYKSADRENTETASTSDSSAQSETEQTSSDVFGLMETSAKGLTTVYTTPEDGVKVGDDTAGMIISDIVSQPSENGENAVTDLEGAIQNSVVYPLYSMFGANMLLQPLAYPALYTYTLEKVGEDYRWTIAMNDAEEYNKELDAIYESSYGTSRLDLRGDQSLVADRYELTKAELIITTDKDGALKKVENNNSSEIELDGTVLDLTSADTVTVEAADAKWSTFFKGFFDAISSQELKKGDSFKLNQEFEASESSETSKDDSKEAEDSNASAADSKADDKKDSKTDSKDESKQDSKADSKKDSKADDKADSSKKDDKSKESKTESKTDDKKADSKKDSAAK